MKLISWNVNGLRACLGKGFLDFCKSADADVICLQETKMKPEQADFDLPGYEKFWNSADKPGYSGTAVLTRIPPVNVTYDFGGDEHRHEGRVITAEFEGFFLVCRYTPNAQVELRRIDYRMRWEDDFRDYLQELDRVKPVVLCGDLNVAHEEIDLKTQNQPGPRGLFRSGAGKMTELLNAGFPTPSGSCIQRKSPTPGGAIVFVPGRRTLAGASTILLSPGGFRKRCRIP